MDDSRFWAIIEAPAGQVKDVHRLFWQRMTDAQTWDLWGAAYLVNGGCSDDGFVYFRAWLISQGRAIYTAAVENPDSMAGVTSERARAGSRSCWRARSIGSNSSRWTPSPW